MKLKNRLLQGATNFRDLGGYKTKDGRRVKSGYFFRSDHLHELTDSDIRHLEKANFKLICDYRADFEQNEKPNVHIPGTNTIRLNIKGPEIKKLALAGELHTLGQVDEIMPMYYRKLANLFQPYRTLFELILEQENLPMVQHCSAGKDRTGFGVALILLALGVSEDIVMEDYLLSNHYRAQYNKKIVSDLKNHLKDENELAILIALIEVRKEYLEAAFDEIHIQFGSIDQYLEEALGLTKSKRLELKERFLE